MPVSASIPVPLSTATTQSLLLVRKVQKSQSVAECLALIPDDDPDVTLTEDVALAALHICWKNSDIKTATQLLDRYPTEPCRTLVISIAGKKGDYQAALKLLRASTSPSKASYHACLAACGKAHAWHDCLQLYHKLESSHRTTFTANIVLSAMAKSNRGDEALEFFKTVRKPDAQSVLKTMTALIGMGDDHLDRAHEFMVKYGGSKNNDLLIDRLASAYAKTCNWEMVRRLNAGNGTGSFQPWTVLPKIGKGRTAYWKLGTFTNNKNSNDCHNFTVGLHPHRNPSKNGIKLLLVEGGTKIGFLLMKNNATESSLLGVFLDPNQRQRGLSKIFLAIWMTLCLEADITANTGVMNKPLLCLTLQHTFGYTPPPDKGVQVEIAPSTNAPGKIVIYSATAKSIAGAFSPGDIKREGLAFASTPPEPRGRVVHMKSCLFPPDDDDVLAATVAKVLSASGGKFDFDRDHPIKTILCGE